jgi:predicted ATPase/class 3 adenylate cyclase
MDPRSDPSADRATGSTMTFLFTDIEGSTRRWEESTDMFELVSRHFSVLDDEVQLAGGTVFATLGDGIASAFRSANAAVQAAVNAQRRLRDLGLGVRMGMHTGEVERAGADFRGRTVNRASRVMSVASGGQIIVSNVTASLLQSGIADLAYGLSDLGSHRLRGLAAPERLWQVDAPDLPGAFPPVQSERPGPVGLPVHRSSLVGRIDDERRVRALLDDNRVVTLTGVGGVGKTRLAAHVARRLMSEYRSIGFTTLSSITDSSDVAAAIVAALSDLDGWTVHDGVASNGDGAAAARTLLVVDNCEHVVDGAADAINDLANRWPSLTVLATSREQLGIDGEHVVVIRPLALDAAVRLFRERAAAAGADLGAAARGPIEALCRRLDGVPLAIELASARAASLPVSEILAALDTGEPSCLRRRRPGPDRHVTLDATIAWSYRLLDEQERRLFAWLSVFPNGFEFDAARHVAESLALGRAAPTAIESLVTKSMISAEPASVGVRYRMLETMRAFALDRLDERAERLAARRVAADWVASLAGPHHGGPCTAEVERAARRLEREQEAWRDAVILAVELESSELAGGLCGPPANFFLLGRHDLVDLVRPLLDIARRSVDRRAVLCSLIVAAAGVTPPQQLTAWADEVQSIDRRSPTGLGALMRWLALAWSGRFSEAVDVCVAASKDHRLDHTTRDLLVGIAILDHFSLTEARDDRHGLLARATEVAARAEMALTRVSCRLGLAWGLVASDPDRSISLVRQGLDDIAEVPALTRLTLPGSASRLLSELDPAIAARSLLAQIDVASRDSFADMIPLFYGAALLERVGDPDASPTLATVAARPLAGAASMMDFVDQARRAARRRDDVGLETLERSVRDGLQAIIGASADVAVSRD